MGRALVTLKFIPELPSGRHRHMKLSSEPSLYLASTDAAASASTGLTEPKTTPSREEADCEFEGKRLLEYPDGCFNSSCGRVARAFHASGQPQHPCIAQCGSPETTARFTLRGGCGGVTAVQSAGSGIGIEMLRKKTRLRFPRVARVRGRACTGLKEQSRRSETASPSKRGIAAMSVASEPSMQPAIAAQNVRLLLA